MRNYKNTIEEVYLATLACMPEGGHWSAKDIEQTIRDWRDESDESDKLAAYLWTDEDIKNILDGVIELIEQNPDVSLIWYAVEMDEDDNDWGTGSYSLEEAKEMAERMDAKYIAVIDGSECVEVIEMDPEPKRYVESYKTYKDGSYQSDADGQGFEAKNDAEAWGMVIANEKETMGWDYTVDSVEIAGGIASIRYHDEDGAEYEEEIRLYYKDADGQLIQVEAE